MIGPKVHVHAADAGGVGMNRCIWPGRALQASGFDVTIFEGDESGKLNVHWRDDPISGEPQVVGVDKPPCDVIVLQRPLHVNSVAVIPHLQARGVAVVIEIDDAFEVMDRRNVAWAQSNPAMSKRRNWDNLRRACELADVVTCTTPALADRYGHGHGVVIPNYVPESYLDIPKTPHEGPPIVGWTGSLNTHPDDLPVMGGAIAELCRRDIIQFRVVGTGMGVAEQLGLDDRYTRWQQVIDEEVWSKWMRDSQARPRGADPLPLPEAKQVVPWWATGWVPLHAYPEAVARFDVGLVPLALTPFNEAKSTLKGLEYAATASSFVASPTGPYSALSADTAIGRTALKPSQWKGAVTYLASVADEAGELDRLTIRANDLTYEAQAGRWAAAWALAANRRAQITRDNFIPADERKLLA